MVNLTVSDWKFLTNHALVLGCIDRHPHTTARELASTIGITERTVLKIVGELDSGGYITRKRRGRRNAYRVNSDAPLRSLEAEVPVGDLLRVISPKSSAPQEART